MKNGDWRVNRSPSMTYEGKRNSYEDKKQEVFYILGQECSNCGFSDIRALQIDHVNGGGSKARKSHSGTSGLYFVLNNIHLFQILCANCNWIKRHENKEQPKRKG